MIGNEFAWIINEILVFYVDRPVDAGFFEKKQAG